MHAATSAPDCLTCEGFGIVAGHGGHNADRCPDCHGNGTSAPDGSLVATRLVHWTYDLDQPVQPVCWDRQWTDPISTCERYVTCPRCRQVLASIHSAALRVQRMLAIPADPAPQRAEIDGEALNAMHNQWRAGIYRDFEGAQTVDAMMRSEQTRTSKFISIAALVEQRMVIALFVAEAYDEVPGQPRNVQVTARTLPAPTDPEALPEPFRTLALTAFAR